MCSTCPRCGLDGPRPGRPLGVYGASKEGGEQAVRTGNPRHAVVRTSWVVSAQGRNFVTTMLRAGAERPDLRVVADQRGSPTSRPTWRRRSRP
jgi:dTDP-4-dehydrorhamnose reductase